MLVNISLKVRYTINMTITFLSYTRESLGFDVKRECPKTGNFFATAARRSINSNISLVESYNKGGTKNKRFKEVTCCFSNELFKLLSFFSLNFYVGRLNFEAISFKWSELL